ncbi:MAG: hypothetical protein H6590_10260 [Flavobacteriales bacterium]|nr:hypothetical protein [Flavobacteriales bacterium]
MIRIASILGVIMFAINAADQIGQGHLRLGALLVIVSLVNVFGLLRLSGSRERQVLINALNVVVAGATAVMYFRMGKQGLPWMWLAVMVGYGIAIWRFRRRRP